MKDKRCEARKRKKKEKGKEKATNSSPRGGVRLVSAATLATN